MMRKVILVSMMIFLVCSGFYLHSEGHQVEVSATVASTQSSTNTNVTTTQNVTNVTEPTKQLEECISKLDMPIEGLNTSSVASGSNFTGYPQNNPQTQSPITTTPTTHVPTISHSVSQSLSHTIASSHVLITSTDINLALIGVGISILIGVFLVYRRR
ncbi:hypothetical protein [Sulfuracidifex tepidarius]|uniref:Uncharacterized protein n=2 Tax=Sulfuracidifex tepidarius TaxID=1294262 RepID=A0A510DT44_9CREN|nr:hypothetical protein [Sulfuracidifex tepidarius]BBG23363.1 hypothetical protein IC006_0647 [Sulfuracidifex tepidarius]BBG26114.1 hypothetical protein IC007_0619 [Sulfuracidifex tepidarius]